jgi:thiamine transport system permease protein
VTFQSLDKKHPSSGLTHPGKTRGRFNILKQSWLLLVLPAAFLIFFFFYPLTTIFSSTLREFWAGKNLLADYDIWTPLGFTFYQAGLSTLFTLALGLPAAYLFARFQFPGKKTLQALTTLPFILPTVVVAAGFNALIGPRGWVNLLLMNGLGLSTPPIQILNSLPAILLAHVFYNTTIIIRVVGTSWSQLDPRLEQAARTLGANPWRTFFEVTLPLLRPAILAASLLVFLFDFTSFGVILMLGGPKFSTLEVEIYMQSMVMLNLPLAGLLSAIQLFLTMLLSIAYNAIGRNAPVPIIPRLKGEGQRKARRLSEKLLVISLVLVLILLLLMPLAAVASRSVIRLDADRGQHGAFETGLTLDYYRELFINRRNSIFYVPPLNAAGYSLLYGSLTVVFALALGLPTAIALARPSRLTRIISPIIMLPLGASAVTLGLGYILVFNRPPLDVRSFWLLVPIAHSLVALPFVVRTLQPAITSIPNNLRQAAAVMGAAPWRVWVEVDLPVIARAAAVAAIFSFTISLGEFGATAFLSRPEYPTLPIAIYRFLAQPGGLNYGQAMAMSTLLMLLCAACLVLIDRLND